MVRTGKPKGRPSKGGSLNKFLRIDDNVRKVLDLERSHGERYNDTIKRILFVNSQKIEELEWQNATLESENDRLKSLLQKEQHHVEIN